ncbi:hypothetical protein ACIGAN_30130 [Streptomyces sp. NPDC085931]|uniref:hypothetical protein n=1 Tax=Streptomyces sp. NPDC085931 TaxID=3365740 RepID=UPI0037D6DC54
MGEWRLHRTLPSLATEAGLGSVRRVHHERRPWPVLLTGKLVLDAVTIPLLIRALTALDVTPSARPFAVFGWLLASWAALAHWVLFRDGRRSVAVCDGGLLIHTDGMGRSRPVVIPWDAVTTPEGTGPLPPRLHWRLHWLDNGTQRHITLHTLTARDALIESVESRRPSAAPPHPRLLAGTAFTAVAVIQLWALTLSPLAGIVLAHRAYDLRDFASLCTHPGASFPESAPRTTTGPHPTVLFDEEHGTDPVVTSTGGDGGRTTAAPDPDAVQLVACSRLVRRQVDLVCTYDGGESQLTFHRARYRIDVHEARTGRRIAGHTVDADDSDSCPYWLAVGRGRGREERVAAPAEEEYQHLADSIAADGAKPS